MRRFFITLISALLLVPAAASAQGGKDNLYDLFHDYGKTYKGFVFKDVTGLYRTAKLTLSAQDKEELDGVRHMYYVAWHRCTEAVQKSFLAELDRITDGWVVYKSDSRMLMYKAPEGGEYVSDPIVIKDVEITLKNKDEAPRMILFVEGSLPLKWAKEICAVL